MLLVFLELGNIHKGWRICSYLKVLSMEDIFANIEAGIKGLLQATANEIR